MGSNRVNRGGSWNNPAENCRSAYRNRNTPSNRNNNLGFRVARSFARRVDACRTKPDAFRLGWHLRDSGKTDCGRPVLVVLWDERSGRSRIITNLGRYRQSSLNHHEKEVGMKNLAYNLAHLGVLWYTLIDCHRQMTLDSESETVFSDLCQRSSTVELWFCKPVVVGSNPTVGFIFYLQQFQFYTSE